MHNLNYHHLMYFRAVAREGSIAAAGKTLYLSSPTISEQIKALEAAVGRPLFERLGRKMVLTESGQMLLGYADGIFSLGQELMRTLSQQPLEGPMKLVIGVADSIPKLVARRLIEPVLSLAQGVELVCWEDSVVQLLGELSAYRIDVILSDVPAGHKVRAFSHELAECGVTFLGTDGLVARYGKNFPACLDRAPVYLPTKDTALRQALEAWFETEGLRPVVKGEFKDRALLETFGQGGEAFFPASALVEKEICRQHNVRAIGRAAAVREHFYAISPERRLEHPGVIAICRVGAKKLKEIPNLRER